MKENPDQALGRMKEHARTLDEVRAALNDARNHFAQLGDTRLVDGIEHCISARLPSYRPAEAGETIEYEWIGRSGPYERATAKVLSVAHNQITLATRKGCVTFDPRGSDGAAFLIVGRAANGDSFVPRPADADELADLLG